VGVSENIKQKILNINFNHIVSHEGDGLKKGAIIVIICAVIFLSVVISAFIYFSFVASPLTLEPEVRVTNDTYQQWNFSGLGELPIWDEFNDEYGGRYSDRLRDAVIDNMKDQAEELDEDPEVLEKCLEATGQFDESNNNRLPCLAEKAKYEYHPAHIGKDWHDIELNESELSETVIDPCWIIVINWGLPDEPLGHIKIYIISAIDYEVLSYTTCD
jgi:hypothetical protein